MQAVQIDLRLQGSAGRAWLRVVWLVMVTDLERQITRGQGRVRHGVIRPLAVEMGAWLLLHLNPQNYTAVFTRSAQTWA